MKILILTFGNMLISNQKEETMEKEGVYECKDCAAQLDEEQIIDNPLCQECGSILSYEPAKKRPSNVNLIVKEKTNLKTKENEAIVNLENPKNDVICKKCNGTIPAGEEFCPKCTGGWSYEKHKGEISPIMSAIFLSLVGGLVIAIGIYFTPAFVAAGYNVAYSRSNSLTRLGGIIWLSFGPCLPYILLGSASAVIQHLSDKRNNQPILRKVTKKILFITSIVLSLFIFMIHAFSPVFKYVAESLPIETMFDASKSFGIAIFYFVAGVIIMLIVAKQLKKLLEEK
ncbi:hypothetical protein ACFLZ5_05585 [Thermodesulfobacteriota bacterium]